jgi:hypothetical protein
MGSKKAAILQSNYIPWKGYFDLMDEVDVFVIYDEVQYTKNDWRNRNLIKTPKGTEWLTIPVRQKSLEQKISETEITFPKWNKKHWKTIQANYSKAPFFKEYSQAFEELYLNSNVTNLSKVNLTFIEKICEILNIDTEIIDSAELDLTGDKNDRLINICQQLGADEYLSGPAAKSYLDEQKFKEAGISVEWMDYSGYPKYEQLQGEFEHGVTVLDLIFNTGDQARKYLKKEK